MSKRLGRGLDALLHVVEDKMENIPSKPSPASLWPVEHPDSLTPPALRLSVRERLEKLSTRPRHGVKAARAYLDKLRRQDGRISLDLTTSRFDLTGSTLLHLKDGILASIEKVSKK